MHLYIEERKTALQNALNYGGFIYVEVYHKLTHDKRKTKPKFFLQIGKETISPTLEYEMLNMFIMGMIRVKQITERPTTF
jgi:hypothetical protein